MKKGMYFILLAIISLVCYTLFYNAKTHVKAVETTNELVTKADSLITTVKILHKEKDLIRKKEITKHLNCKFIIIEE